MVLIRSLIRCWLIDHGHTVPVKPDFKPQKQTQERVRLLWWHQTRAGNLRHRLMRAVTGLSHCSVLRELPETLSSKHQRWLQKETDHRPACSQAGSSASSQLVLRSVRLWGSVHFNTSLLHTRHMLSELCSLGAHVAPVSWLQVHP